MPGKTVPIHGGNFREFRTAVLGVTQAQFAELLGVSEPLVRSIEKTASYQMRQSRVTAVARRLGIDNADFERVFGFTGWTEPAKLQGEAWVQRLISRFHEPATGRAEAGGGVALRTIPYFEFRIPAGGWADTIGSGRAEEADGHVPVPASLPEDAFAIRIDGDCMEPTIANGSIIVCVPLGTGTRASGFVDGKIYYVQSADDRATFKRVFWEADRHRYRLECDNPTHETRYEPDRQIVRLSRAVQVIQDLI